MNLRHCIVVFSAVASFGTTYAQTSFQLVNGDFEANTVPTGMGQFYQASHWGNAGSVTTAPDLYHYLADAAADIPETPMAMVNPSAGEALMGISLTGKDLTNTREYLSSQLSSPLVPGQQYFFGFKITNGSKTETSLAGLGVSDIGVLFTTSPVTQADNAPILSTPQLKIDTVLYDRDWVSVNFVFTATQAYEYMTFGVFGADASVEIDVIEGSDPHFAYYFVDEFYLEPTPEDYEPTNQDHSKGDHNEETEDPVVDNVIPSPEPFFIPNSFTPNNDGDNDLFIPVANTLKEWEFCIFTGWGEKVFCTEDETFGWDGTFRAENCPNGNYVWQISYIVWNDVTGANRVVKKGIVVLLR